MLRNCATCGRLLVTPPGTPCMHCRQEEDAAVTRINDYLKGGGAPSFAQVAEGAGVKPALLRRLTRSGRIALSDAGGTAVRACSVCGRAVAGASERICPACASRIGGRAAAPGRAAAAPGRPRPVHPGGFYSRSDEGQS